MTIDRSCPDCTGKLTKVSIIDLMGQQGVQDGLTFLQDGHTAQVSIFSKEVANRQGVIHGYVCDGCRRVLFYAAFVGD